MRSPRSILALRYTPVSVAGGVRKAVGGFIRYVQYRDQHLDAAGGQALDAYLRYVAHRDRSGRGARVFGRGVGIDRREFVDYVARSTKGLEPKWVVGQDGKRQDRQRAVYTFILSPEDWRGLNLRDLARTAMAQLEMDSGPAGIGPWIAAEHRNTAHHHVHIVLAARREVAPGHFSTLVVTRARLQRMKQAIALEIDRQRSVQRPLRRDWQVPRAAMPAGTHRLASRSTRHLRWMPIPAPKTARWSRPTNHGQMRSDRSVTLRGLRAVARQYQRRMEHELEDELARRDREGLTR